MDKPCQCSTVQRHGNQWTCMLCGKEFIPAPAKISNLERMLRDDYKVNGSGTG